MLSGLVLNSDATVNNFKEIGSKQFIPGEQFTLVVRLFNNELDLRYIPPVTTLRSITFNNRDGSTLTKSNADITVFTDDRSIMSVVISEAESLELSSGNFSFELDILGDGSEIRKGIVLSGLSPNNEGAC